MARRPIVREHFSCLEDARLFALRSGIFILLWLGQRLMTDCSLGLKAQRAQGRQRKTKVLPLPPISQLKTRMRQLVWQEAVEDVIKHSHERPVIRRLERLLAA